MVESTLLRHEQCPACAAQGRDVSKNNLGVYSDGHHYCFSCGYTLSSDPLRSYSVANTPIEKHSIYLPQDVTPTLPTEQFDWLHKYELSDLTIRGNNIMWSEYQQKLIFPYFVDGELVAWQGRTFNPEEKKKRKWFSQGDLKKIIYTVGPPSETLILTESIISAIKVSTLGYKCSPIWGSVIPKEKAYALSLITNHIILWLDPDKHAEAVTEANKLRIYTPIVDVFFSPKKPKDLTLTQIKEYLP